MRLPLPVLAAIVLQAVGFWTAGCAARGASPIRVDDTALEMSLRHDLDACQDTNAAHDLLAREIVDYAALADRLAAERAALRRIASMAADAADAGQSVSGAAVEALNRGFSSASAAVHEVAMTAARHDPWRRSDAPRSDLKLRVLGSALSAAAALELYDSYLDTGALIATHPALRKIIDRGDSGFGIAGGQLDALTRDYLSLARRYRTHDTLVFLRDHREILESADDPHICWLRERIQASPSARTLRAHWLVPLPEFAGETVNLVESDLRRLADATMGGASQGFGNAVGAVQFRRGKLFDDPAVELAVHSILRPGDILLEKTPFRLTDRFIPGHWGHVAIWLGNDNEARELLGDDPLLASHMTQLASGAGVCEALRDGVQLNPLSRFLDVDDLCVLRAPGLAGAELAEHLRRSLRQLGKAYDFNFDVETADRIVCSELVYQVYTGIPWPTGKTMGRWTISPDQVAIRAVRDGPLRVVGLWHDGRRVDGDLGQALADLIETAR
jgi:uncharacterized protein YycO